MMELDARSNCIPADTTDEDSIRKEFQKNGYVIARDFFAPEEMGRLIETIKVAGKGRGISATPSPKNRT